MLVFLCVANLILRNFFSEKVIYFFNLKILKYQYILEIYTVEKCSFMCLNISELIFWGDINLSLHVFIEYHNSLLKY